MTSYLNKTTENDYLAVFDDEQFSVSQNKRNLQLNNTWNHQIQQERDSFLGYDDFSREITQAVKERFSTKYYPLLAVMAGISFALHNVFFYQTTTYNSVAVVIPYWIGQVPILLVLMLIQARQEKIQTGKYWSKETSKYYKEDGTLNWEILKGLMIRTALAFASIICFYFTLSTCHKSHVNLAVIISITAVAAVFTAIVFQFMFDERMRLKHWVGMFFLLCGIMLISQSQNTESQEYNQSEAPTLSVWFPIMFALFGAVVHTSISVTGRVYMMKGVSAAELTTDAFFLQGLILCVINIIFVLSGGVLPTNIMCWAGIGSFFNMVGFFLCTEASVYGKAGPSQALMELQSVFQLLMEIALFGRVPNIIETGGMCFALVGTFTIAIGKDRK